MLFPLSFFRVPSKPPRARGSHIHTDGAEPPTRQIFRAYLPWAGVGDRFYPGVAGYRKRRGAQPRTTLSQSDNPESVIGLSELETFWEQQEKACPVHLLSYVYIS